MKSSVRGFAVLVATLLLPLVIPVFAASQPKAIATLYFFFSPSGCGYCRDQAPLVEQFQRDHPDIKVIGIPLSGPDETVRKFVSQTGITFEVRRDKEKIARVDVSRHPAIAIYGTQCDTFRQVSRGEISSQELNKWVSDFLRKCRGLKLQEEQLPGIIYKPGGC